MHAEISQSKSHMIESNLQLVDDDLLVEHTRSEVDAFEALYTRYSGPVYRMCMRATSDPDVAVDLTSVIFLKAFERLDQYQRMRKGTFRAWLFTIARNSMLDHWRRNKRLSSIPESLPDFPDTDPGPEDIALMRMQLDDVREILATLSEQNRSIIEFRIVGLTTRKIADALDMSISSVKFAQTRTYAKIRNHLLGKGELQ